MARLSFVRWSLPVALAALSMLTVQHVAGQQSGVIESVSFRPPFNTFDLDGKRQIQNYAYGGNVDVNENFIRITPDRASKRGWIWARNPLDVNEWTATLRFRVSGQGKRLFGDGFALWFTQNRFALEGKLHGFYDKFTGFGIVFDTFRNSELNHVHKDVALFINDGTNTVDPGSMKEILGCDSEFRYWEGRDDFGVTNKSVAKITFSNNKLTVAIDAKNTGTFKECVADVPLNLPADWFKSAYLGLTATTGQLADNHDVLSLMVSSQKDEVLSDKPQEADVAVPSTGNPQLDALVRIAVEREMKALTERLTNLHHTLEHQLSAVNDGLSNNIKKLVEQDASNVHRIVELEAKLHSKVESDVKDKVQTAVDATMETRIAAIETILKSKFDAKLNTELEPKLEKAVEKQLGSAGGWKLPFFVLVAVVGGLAAFAYKKYKHLMKTHLL